MKNSLVSLVLSMGMAAAIPSGTAPDVGCYSDPYITTTRTLDEFPRLIDAKMTQYMCQSYCAQFNSALYGVEYSTECYCGNSIKGGAVARPSTECNYPCGGDATKTCGGSARMYLYGVVPPSSSSTTSAITTSTTAASSASIVPAVSSGCYVDVYPNGRTLDDFPRFTSDKMTPSMCQQYCAQYSAAFYGVEYYSECYCGNSLLGGAMPAPASDCNTPCSGDSSQMCGGGSRLNIYGKVPSPVSTSATATSTAVPVQGGLKATCYTDPWQATTRTLDDFPRFVSDSMTPPVCQQYCAQFSAALFGIEYGTECYCGNAIHGGALVAPITECGFACPGDRTQICGAGNRMIVYGAPAAVMSSSTTAVLPSSSSTTIVLPSSSSTTAVTPSSSSTTAVMPSSSSTTIVLPSSSSTTAVLPSSSSTTFVTSSTSSTSTSATPSPTPVFAPFSCPSNALVSEGQTLYSLDPATTTTTQIQTGFGLPSGMGVNALGYNVQDNFLYAVTDATEVIRISSNNKYQSVITLPATPGDYGYSAGDVDNNNQLWLFSGNTQWTQVDTRTNTLVATGTATVATYVNDWVYLSGGGSALWSVNIINKKVVLLRFDMATKTFTTVKTYTLLTGNTSTTFNAMFAISSTVFEAVDAITLQVWRFDIASAAAPVKQPSISASNGSRDMARCITNL